MKVAKISRFPPVLPVPRPLPSGFITYVEIIKKVYLERI